MSPSFVSSFPRTTLFSYAFLFFIAGFMACTPPPEEANITASPSLVSDSEGPLLDSYCTSCSTCACTGTGGGKDYSNQTLSGVNFYAEEANLVGANFSGATLIGCVFDNLDLSNANFSGVICRADSLGGKTSFSGANLSNTCFTKASLGDVDFQFSTFHQTDFTCANISNAEFGPMMSFQGDTSSRTKFNYAQISMSDVIYVFPLNNFAASDWAKTDFTYTRFNGLSNANFKPQGKDLSYAKLRGINFASYDLRQCNFTKADLAYANLNFAHLDSVIAYGTSFAQANLNQTSMIGADFYATGYPGTSFFAANMNGSFLNNADLQHVIFTGANLDGAQAKAANLQYANMEGCCGQSTATLNGANFSGADLSYANLDHVIFQNNFLLGTKFQYVDISNTNFSDLVMSGADFYHSTLEEVLFINSKLHNANFNSCTFNAIDNGNGVTFTCAQLGGSDFSNATVNMANFSYAVIPPDSSCCLLKDSTYNCGTDSWTSEIYGSTTLPTLKVPVECPIGNVKAICTGDQWQIRGWQTTSCDQDGKNETVWVAPDCNGHPDSTGIQIKDPSLKQCIANQLFDGDTTQIITTALAATITALDCGKMGIMDISGLEYFPNLTQLDLTANRLSQDQFSTLSPKLTTLKLAYNDLTSISLGAAQDNMAYLDASNNNLSTINIAEKYLTFIDLSHNQLSGDMTSFQLFKDLVYLDLSFNKLQNIGDLSGLSEIQTLFLENNLLKTIGDLSSQWACGRGVLYNINLQNNDCFECNTLNPNSNCNQFNIITMSNCQCQATCGNCTPVQ